MFRGILSELEEANSLISADDIIDGDIIYYGDGTKWEKLINSFRLKVLMILSNKEGDSDLNVATLFADVAENQPTFTSIAANGQLEFFDQIGSQYGEFNDSDYGSGLYVDSILIKRLQDRQDPRLFTD